MKTELTFSQLREANLARVLQYRNKQGELSHIEGVATWTPADWVLATGGELGELANLLKKLNRGDYGTVAEYAETLKEIQNELADTMTYLDLLAARLDVNLGEAVVSKFNEVSERVGSEIRL